MIALSVVGFGSPLCKAAVTGEEGSHMKATNRRAGEYVARRPGNILGEPLILRPKQFQAMWPVYPAGSSAMLARV